LGNQHNYQRFKRKVINGVNVYTNFCINDLTKQYPNFNFDLDNAITYADKKEKWNNLINHGLKKLKSILKILHHKQEHPHKQFPFVHSDEEEDKIKTKRQKRVKKDHDNDSEEGNQHNKRKLQEPTHLRITWANF
jgi:hypothetical protein